MSLRVSFPAAALAALLLVVIPLSPCADQAHATARVRVALLQQIGLVQVGSAKGLLLRIAGEPEWEWPHARPVTVGTGGPGGTMTLNGRPLRGDLVMIRSRNGELVVNDLPVGGVVIVRRQGGRLLVVNEVDLEDYVAGVVPHEMSAGWHPEALKAQAVAARTYVLYQRLLNSGRDYDVVATTQDQVYRGRVGLDPRTRQAVDETRSLVVTYQDAPILAAFSSTAAGPTEDAMNVWQKDLPYLKGVDCPFDGNSPYYEWRNTVNVERLEANLRQQGYPVGTIASLTPFWYSRAGRVMRVRILHSGGELILRGEDLRRVIGYAAVPSTLFQVEAFGREIVLSGRGNGHAVGLCQWGAKELAERGYAYQAILAYYFPGTELKQADALALP